MPTFGKQTYEAFAETYPAEVHEPWDELDSNIQADWDRAAQAAVTAYDLDLQGKADAYAEQVAQAPTFDQQLAQAVAADEHARFGPGPFTNWTDPVPGASVEPEPAAEPAPAEPSRPVRDYSTY